MVERCVGCFRSAPPVPGLMGNGILARTAVRRFTAPLVGRSVRISSPGRGYRSITRFSIRPGARTSGRDDIVPALDTECVNTFGRNSRTPAGNSPPVQGTRHGSFLVRRGLSPRERIFFGTAVIRTAPPSTRPHRAHGPWIRRERAMRLVRRGQEWHASHQCRRAVLDTVPLERGPVDVRHCRCAALSRPMCGPAERRAGDLADHRQPDNGGSRDVFVPDP